MINDNNNDAGNWLSMVMMNDEWSTSSSDDDNDLR